MITRDEAHRIAEHAIISGRLGTGVHALALVDELQVRPPMIYGGPDLRTCWIAYAERPLRGLMASTIVLIDRESGAVRYSGSANDEG